MMSAWWKCLPTTGHSLLSHHLVLLWRSRCPPFVFLAVGMPGYLLPHLRGPFADIILPAHSCPEYQGCLSTLGRARVGATVTPPVGCTPVFLP